MYKRLSERLLDVFLKKLDVSEQRILYLQQTNFDDKQQDDENKNNQQNQNNQDKMSKDNAEQLLNAAIQQEKDTKRKMQKAMSQPRRKQYEKNW
jgi:hypothetical protein